MKRFCLVLIQFYQAATIGARTRCRFWPSCSHYAYEAIDIHGVRRGATLALRRILRCRPWGGAGIDLVPHKERPSIL